MLKFLIKYISDYRFAFTLIKVADIVIGKKILALMTVQKKFLEAAINRVTINWKE